MKKLTIALCCASLLPFLCNAKVPSEVTQRMEKGDFNIVESLISQKNTGMTEFEVDSVRAIMQRIRSDFRYTMPEGLKEIQKIYPFATQANVDVWESKNYIETKIIDGEKRMYRKAISNLKRLVPELSAKNQAATYGFEQKRAERLRGFIDAADPKTGLDKGHRVTIKYTIDVDADVVPAGKKIRVWMPFPIESERQKNAKLISSNLKATKSTGSVHNTVYMEQKAKKGEKTHYEMVFSYDVYAKTLSQDYLLANVKPYDVNSEVYKTYTASVAPQMLITEEMTNLARLIVGNETNPVKQASLIYDWIDANFPWAGAREYSTIPNLPSYVLQRGYGDCGQVSLLYITLCRNIGIPARWESGWEFEPDNDGIHDWSETYFEGIGWVPTDMSFGVNRATTDPEVMNFFKSGIDSYRFAANTGVCGKLSPEKKFIRSETIDSQVGEVEWDGGNLFYNDWDYNLTILSVEEIH